MYYWDWGAGFKYGEGENETISKRGNFLLRNRKILSKEHSQNILKSCLSFGEHLESSNEEKMGRQQKEEVL